MHSTAHTTMINETDVFPALQKSQDDDLEVRAVVNHQINNEGHIEYLVEFTNGKCSWMINCEGYEMVVVKYFENRYLNSLIENKKRKYNCNTKRKMNSTSTSLGKSKKRKLNTIQ